MKIPPTSSGSSESSGSRRQAAFSLVELLTVMAIMVAMIGLGAAAVLGLARSSRVTTSSNIVMDALAQARQRAVTQNCRVEVRFYQLPPGHGTGLPAYRALRAVRIGQDGISKELDRVQKLADTVIISDLPNQNTIFQATAEEKEDLSTEQKNVAYRAITFLPNGQTELNLGLDKKWFLTLYDGQQAATAPNNLPSNYAVVQIDAFTGNARLLRP